MLKTFAANRKGNFAIMFALASFPILAGVGMMIEYSNLTRNKAALQNAVDASILFAGKYYDENGTLPSDADVEKFVAANFDGTLTKVKMKKEGDKIVVTADSKVEQFFFQQFAPSLFNQTADATVPVGQKSAIEIALVLDNTNSMSVDGKMTALKSVASSFIDKMVDATNSNTKISMGIVPFSNHVNVGLTRRNESWLDVADDSSTTTYSCEMETVGAVATNCRTETRHSDGVPYQANVCDWTGGTQEEVCKDRTVKQTWHGCVGTRAQPESLTDKNYSTKVPGIFNDSGCPTEIATLTTSLATLKTPINAMVPKGDTYIGAGAEWGWKMLSSNAPLSEAKPQNGYGSSWKHSKVMILMTDGDNQRAPEGSGGKSNWSNDLDKANDWTKEVCENARKDKITIYSIAFGTTVSTTGKAVMQECAGTTGGYFEAKDAAELQKAFDAIAGKLVRLRLSS